MRGSNPYPTWTSVPIATKLARIFKTITYVTVTYDASASASDPVSSSAASGVTSAANSIIIPLGHYDSSTTSMTSTSVTVSMSPTYAWEWSGTDVRVRHTSSSGRSTGAITTTYKAVVVEFA